MRAAAFLLTVFVASATAGPPVVTVAGEVSGDVGAFVAIRASVTDAKAVKFVALDQGLNVFPPGLLADKTATVVSSGKAGRYRVLCYSGNAEGPSEPVVVAVVIGGVPPPVVDPVKPDPDRPDVAKAERVAVVVVEESQTRTVEQAKTVAELRKWAEGGGHTLFTLDKDDPAAKRNGYLPLLKELPGVIVFDQKGGGKPLSVFKMPDTGEALTTQVKKVVK